MISAFIVAMSFDINEFILGNISSIRGDFILRKVTFFEQITPLLLIYPFIYISYKFLKETSKFSFVDYTILFLLVFFGLSSGGRAFIFEILLLFVFINKPNVFTMKFIFGYIIVSSLFAFITIGRFSNIDSYKVKILEAGAPLKFNEFLKDRSEYPIIKDIIVEFVFYFGQGIPAFCNKFDNLRMTILPHSFWGIQPFVERQLIRWGILNYSQEATYDELTNLSNGSGFFKVSWSTGFLDIYFHEGIIFSFFFFILVSVILFITHLNLIRKNEPKYQVLTGFNLLFIVTMFMTPAFMETVAFFSYVTIFLTKVRIS